MKKATLFGLLGIFCLLAGCKKDSQSQPASTSSKPSVVQAAAPAASTASATTPQPDAGTGLLTPHPSASQRVDDRSYLVSSDQNFDYAVSLEGWDTAAVGVQKKIIDFATLIWPTLYIRRSRKVGQLRAAKSASSTTCWKV